MDKRSGPTNRWDTVSLAFGGGLLGAIISLILHLSHAFRGQLPEGEPFQRVLSETAIGAAIGALLLGAISAIRNWLMRDQ